METKDTIENFRLKKIYLDYWERLYAVAFSRTKDEEVSKDLVQDVFMVCWQKFESKLSEDVEIQYLMGVMKNKILDYFRSEKIKTRVFDHINLQMQTFSNDVTDLIQYKELTKDLEIEISSMPFTMQQSFLLKLDGESNQEIARRLNLADQTVHNVLSEAYRRVRKRFLIINRQDQIGSIFLFLQSIHYLLTIK